MRAACICPLSIMPAATTTELRNPRQALDRSKTWVDAGSPILWWANDAEAGSEHVPRDRRMYEQPQLLPLHRGDAQDRAAGGGARLRRERAVGPDPALADSRHELQAAERELEALVERPQLLLYGRGGPDLARQRDGDRFKADIPEAHGSRGPAQRSGLIASRITSLSNMLQPRPASTTSVPPLIPLLRGLRRKSTVFATSWVSRLRFLKVSFSAKR